MNTKIIIGVAVLIAVAIGFWLVLGKEAAEAPSSASSGNETAMSAGEAKDGGVFSGTGSFLELMGMGRNITCDFSYVAEDTNGAAAGTIQVSGERMRGDFEMEQAGETYYSHMIQDGDMIYTWSESPMGDFAIVMPIEEGEDVEADTQEYSRPVSMNNDVDYNCRAWDVDASVFVPPSDIEFMSMEEMFQNMMPEGFDMSDYQ